MIRIQGRLFLMSGAVMGMLLLQACGQNTAAEGNGESFAAVAEAAQGTAEPSPVPENSGTTETSNVSGAFPTAKVEAEATPASKDAGAGDGATVTFKPSPTPPAVPVMTATGKTSKKAAASTPSAEVSSLVQSPGPAAVPKATGKSSTGAEPAKAGVRPAVSPSPPATPAATPAATPLVTPALTPATTAGVSTTGNTNIDWNGFFDGDDQTRPSEDFWNLSGQQVTIKGFMGEVLSFEKNWFLLIPEPGAECPFDNGDETYWNKIMIVFVPEGSKLRYTSGPLEITGRLDVGIKIDESGYKTMFRLYDASFTSL
ncbi:hypothetical protein [Paenibacillus tritici]|uniref:hypothetical protein n=1 Tax=Paenibacillus tritici TaxID=1873425 RepID=UPI001FE9388B|nr:hypothetical protein [Paenibacillus tritici]